MKRLNLRHFLLGITMMVAMTACNNEGSSTTDTRDSATTDNMGQTPVQPATDSNVAAQQTDSVTSQNADAKLAYDLVESMYGGIALIKDGQEKATAQPVKQLAKKLEAAHTTLTNDLKTLAAKKGWSTPAAESASDRQAREDMAKEPATDYQRDWLAALQERHQANIKKLEEAHPADSGLQSIGAKALPKLKDLLNSIETVQKTIK